MPYDRMTKNLHQSIFALIIGAGFSSLLIAFFGIESLIFVIFEVPLAFLIALITITECIYSYNEEVSMQTTFNMIGPLLKSILISIPVVLMYSAIILILDKTVTKFHDAIQPLFDQTIQSLGTIAAIPIICFLPVLLMNFAMPLFLYFYGSIHVLFWGRKARADKKRAKEDLADGVKEKEYQDKIDEVIAKFEDDATTLHQYLLELQAFDSLIEQIEDHVSYKGMASRLVMMKEYVISLAEVPEEKIYKTILKEDEVKEKAEAVKMQSKTIIDIVEKNMKKLIDEKGQFEKEPEEESEEY
ncbi:MAG: hypothetical protein KAS95_02100 [Candidatus Heimdallarchaeota archaeon]|nr:hypothetical protein [Candidatus Heimdallarchaeota archaeon]